MQKIYCFFHADYDGHENPDLSCSMCCTIFVEKIRELNAASHTDLEVWLEQKTERRSHTF